MRPSALFSVGCLAIAAGLGMQACKATSTTDGATDSTETPVATHQELRDNLRALWLEHVTWTRVFLIDTIAGLGDAKAATDRLLQNQVDIGNAIKPFYGDSAGSQLTALLTIHIKGAAEIVAAAKDGDQPALDSAKTAWYANADDIADFLANANPNWNAVDLRSMMHDHLDVTLAEATARLQRDWTGDVAAFNQVNAQILTMSDMLTDGLALQFPSMVTPDPSRQLRRTALHVGLRELWEEHVIWTRIFIIDDLADLPDLPQATDRLLQNQGDIGRAIEPFYGVDAGNQLSALLKAHIAGAVAVVDAAKAGDADALGDAQTMWYANASEIGAFFAKANPNLSERDMKEMMDTHLEQTTAEATHRIKQDWESDIRDYDAVEAHILRMSDMLSDAIANQFPDRLPSQ